MDKAKIGIINDKIIVMAKNYVAISWRNSYQQDVVSFLRNEGHEVYDFNSQTVTWVMGFRGRILTLIGKIGIHNNIAKPSTIQLRKSGLN